MLMKHYVVRYYTDWKCEKIHSRIISAYRIEDVLDSLKHHNTPIKRNSNLLIDIVEYECPCDICNRPDCDINHTNELNKSAEYTS